MNSEPLASNASARAYASIKSDIMNGRLAPNQSLLESDLAAELAMSRTPVREACVKLQADGLVEIVPRRGIRIVPISATDMGEVYDLLATLEARAAELAAGRSMTAEQIEPMDRAVTDMAAALADDNLDAWAAADFDFHRALVQSSGNRHLAATAMQYSELVHRARMVTLRLRPTPQGSFEDHRDLVEAIRSGDAERSYQMHLTHRREAAASLMALLEHHRLFVL